MGSEMCDITARSPGNEQRLRGEATSGTEDLPPPHQDTPAHLESNSQEVSGESTGQARGELIS